MTREAGEPISLSFQGQKEEHKAFCFGVQLCFPLACVSPDLESCAMEHLLDLGL